MKKQITRISILQSSKIATVLYFIMGFIYALIGIPMFLLGHGQIRIIGIIYMAMPVVLAIFGFIFFVIFAAIYNLLASFLGGIEFEVMDIKDEAV